MRGWRPISHAAAPWGLSKVSGSCRTSLSPYENSRAVAQNTRRRMHATPIAQVASPHGPVFYYSDVYRVPMPPAHRFPMLKYDAVRAALERDPRAASAVFRRAPLVSAADLLLAHDSQYVERVLDGKLSAEEIRTIGLPCSPPGVTRARASTGGTVAATRDVLQHPHLRICGQVAGGTHHAFFDRGGGFCVFNDIAVAACVALRDFADSVRTVLIVDLDTHQGDGTAAIFAGDKRVFTFSIHGANNYPSEKMKGDYDVGLADGTSDSVYLCTLRTYIPRLLDRHRPDLVFYQAGVDALEQDALGRLSLSRAGLSARNGIVYRACIERAVPCVVTMGGGYSRPDIGPTVDAVSVCFIYLLFRVISDSLDGKESPRALRLEGGIATLCRTVGLTPASSEGNVLTLEFLYSVVCHLGSVLKHVDVYLDALRAVQELEPNRSCNVGALP